MEQMEHVYGQMNTITSRCEFTTAASSITFFLLAVE